MTTPKHSRSLSQMSTDDPASYWHTEPRCPLDEGIVKHTDIVSNEPEERTSGTSILNLIREFQSGALEVIEGNKSDEIIRTLALAFSGVFKRIFTDSGMLEVEDGPVTMACEKAKVMKPKEGILGIANSMVDSIKPETNHSELLQIIGQFDAKIMEVLNSYDKE